MSNWGGAGWRAVYEISGRAPAVCAWDGTGWNSPTWGPGYGSAGAFVLTLLIVVFSAMQSRVVGFGRAEG
jgi:hypothetical protein